MAISETRSVFASTMNQRKQFSWVDGKEEDQH